MNARKKLSFWVLGSVLGWSLSATGMDDILTLTRDQIEARVGLEQHRNNTAALAALEFLEQHPNILQLMIPAGETDFFSSRPVTLTFENGETAQTRLQPFFNSLVDLGHGVLKRADMENLQQLYSDLHDWIPDAFLTGLPTPDVMEVLPQIARIRSIVLLFQRVELGFELIRQEISVTELAFLDTNFLDDCTTETGWENSGLFGELSERCDVTDYAANGLMANVDFILKDDLTCVKDQGQRGTCVAHAVSAAVEILAKLDSGEAENLSEQHTYFQAKITTHWSTRYDDGLVIETTLEDFVNDEYRIQFEDVWNYNRWLSRPEDPDPVTHQWANPCDFYTGEMCTGYAFQAEEDIDLVFGNPVSVDYTFPSPVATEGHVIQDFTTIPDYSPFFPEIQLDIVIAALESELPVIASFGVADAFRSPDSNGYVEAVTGQPADGNHAVVLIGYVDNADLPAGAPLADDRGYFIAKNSWGTDYADCGFVYLSATYLENYGNNFWYLDDQLN